MQADEAVLYTILRSKSIVTYLDQRGHHPVKRLTGGKLAYRCPMPDHQETKPSFIVYTGGEFENFYCYGCQAKYHIVHLISRMEGISYEESFSRLSKGVEITDKEIAKYHTEKALSLLEGKRRDNDLTDSLLLLSHLCRVYLAGVGYNEEECKVIDGFWATVDGRLNNFQYDDVCDAAQFMLDILASRRLKFDERLRQHEVDKYLDKANPLNSLLKDPE